MVSPITGCASSRSVPFPATVIMGSTCSNNHRQISFVCLPPTSTTARGGRLEDCRRDNPLLLRLWQARRGDPPPPVSTSHPHPQSHRFRRHHLQGGGSTKTMTLDVSRQHGNDPPFWRGGSQPRQYAVKVEHVRAAIVGSCEKMGR